MFAFGIFDLNGDGYVCVKDAFEIISMRIGEYCDNDISQIQAMFVRKRKRNMPKKR